MFNANLACFSIMAMTKESFKKCSWQCSLWLSKFRNLCLNAWYSRCLIIRRKPWFKNLKCDSNLPRVSGKSNSKFSIAYRVCRMVSFKWNEMVLDPLRIWRMNESLIIKYDKMNKNEWISKLFASLLSQSLISFKVLQNTKRYLGSVN